MRKLAILGSLLLTISVAQAKEVTLNADTSLIIGTSLKVGGAKGSNCKLDLCDVSVTTIQCDYTDIIADLPDGEKTIGETHRCTFAEAGDFKKIEGDLAKNIEDMLIEQDFAAIHGADGGGTWAGSIECKVQGKHEGLSCVVRAKDEPLFMNK